MSQAIPIQLRLIYAGHEAYDQVWAISSDAQPLTPLSFALPQGCAGEVELYWLRNTWILRNHTENLRVYINRIALGPKLFFSVQIGDCIEVGNARFRVERRDAAMLALARNIEAQQTTAAQAILSRMQPDEPSIDDNPFDFIPAPAISVLPISSPAAVVEVQETNQAAPDTDWPEDNVQPHSDEMKRLEQAYFDVLSDPHARLEMAYAPTATLGQRFIPPSDQSDAINIEELVCGDVDIDTLLQQINAMPDLSVLHDTEKIDVLRLFAGEYPQHDDSRLPPRTRQDHHLMSLNSEYRLSA